jgi:hypothetical protein
VSTRFRSGGGALTLRLRCGRLLRFHGFPPMSSITNQIGNGKARPSVGRCQAEARSTHKERRLDTPRVFLYKEKQCRNQFQTNRGRHDNGHENRWTQERTDAPAVSYDPVGKPPRGRCEASDVHGHTVITLASSAVSGQGVRGCHSNVGA